MLWLISMHCYCISVEKNKNALCPIYEFKNLTQSIKAFKFWRLLIKLLTASKNENPMPTRYVLTGNLHGIISTKLVQPEPQCNPS